MNAHAKQSSFDKNATILTQHLMRDVKEIFSTMVGLDDLLHLPIQIDPITHFSDCVSALVGMAGSFNGLVCLHMPSELAAMATSNMLGMTVREVNEDVHDAMGEIANMIAGSFKQHLSTSGLDVRLSTPSVVTGKEYIVTPHNNPNQIAVRFATDYDWFMVAVAFESD
ncbi:MAG: chemotaxis protein CheX [Desulfuromonadales bacterium]|nr:chemotaxis protein CheX [Desulfuromonadales bacterium]